MGNKVLRQRLRGPALASYYPRRVATIQDLVKQFRRYKLVLEDEAEYERLEKIEEYDFENLFFLPVTRC